MHSITPTPVPKDISAFYYVKFSERDSNTKLQKENPTRQPLGPGLDSKINGTSVVTFSTPTGWFETSSTPTSKGLHLCFCRYKGVEGVVLMSESEKLTINS